MNTILLKYLSLIIVLSFAPKLWGFTFSDSSMLKISNMPTDTSKVMALIELAEQCGRENDSLYFYYLNQANALANQLNYQMGLAVSYDELGYRHRNRSEYKEALENHLIAHSISKRMGFRVLLPRINNNIGVVYRRLDDYASAVPYHLDALEISLEIGDRKSAMYAKNSLGNVFMLLKQYDQANIYFQQALLQAHEQKNIRSLAINYNNVGELYQMKGQYDDALKYYFKSLEYNQQNQSKRGIAISFDCIGSLYNSMGQYHKALDYFYKALDINREIGDRIYETVSLLNIGKAYVNMGQIEKSTPSLFDALNLALDIGSKSVVSDAYYMLSVIYEQQGDIHKSFDNYKKYTLFKDSVLNETNTKNISKLQTLYDTEKQRKEIALLEQEKLQRDKLGRRKTLFILVLSVAMLLLGLFVLFLYRANLIKRRNNQILRQQSLLISEKNSELTRQKRQVEHVNAKITDSLMYAERIQQAILPQEEVMRELFDDYFVFFRPLSVVSGDFYWVGEYRNKVLFAVSDCTGHGVPGAMMSMLGNSYLNEVIRKPDVLKTNQVLDEMRSMIISSLHQQGGVGESKDGMELSLCMYDKSTGELEFAGAHTSIFIAKWQPDGSYKIIELKGDVMPIGYYRYMKPFTSQTIKVSTNDIIYLYSDGFIDQFGGPKVRRYQRRFFRELLLKNAHLPMHIQRQKLESAFDQWKDSSEQIDDVLVVGIRLKTEKTL